MANYIDTRSFLAANVEVLLENINVRRQAGKIAADDLFGGDDEVKAQIQWLTNVQNRSKIDILLQEKESLGLFVSGNPLEEYEDLLNWVRETSGRDEVYLILINKIRKIFTKAGAMMFAMQISIPEEELEGIIFPKRAMDLSPKLEEKQLFWVKGKISRAKKKETRPAEKSLEKELEPKESEMDGEDESGEPVEAPRQQEIQEYEELPKLMIDSLTRFEEGVIPLFNDEENGLSINRIRNLEKANWTILRTNPEGMTKTTESTKATVDVVSVHPIQTPPRLQSQNNLESTKPLKLAKKLGTEKLKHIKEALLHIPSPNCVQVEVWVEGKEGFKKAKGNFWIPKEIYDTVQD